MELMTSAAPSARFLVSASAWAPAAELETFTIAHHRVIDRLAKRLTFAARTGDRAHTLVIGPPMSGKTHVVRVAVHRATQDAAVGAKLAIVIIQDTDGVLTYSDLLRAVISQLGAEEPAPRGPSSTGSIALEQRILDLLGDRVLVLALESLDRILEDLERSAQSRLRGFVETCRQIVLIGCSNTVHADLRDYDRPWWQSFAVEHLEPLTVEEVTAMLRAFAEARGERALTQRLDQPAAEKTIGQLTRWLGFSPGVWAGTARMLTIDLLDAPADLVGAVLDQQTLRYRQQLLAMSPTQRKLTTALCAFGPDRDARETVCRTVGELAAMCDTSAPVAASVLGRLRQEGVVSSHRPLEGDRRFSRYQLNDDLLRLVVQWWRDPQRVTDRVNASMPSAVATS